MNEVQKVSIKQDPLYQLLREGDIEKFNQRRAQGEECDMTYCDMRGLDLRNMNAEGIDFSHSYFRQADLRGIDFSSSGMEGVSINGSKISGTWFPQALSAEEILLSVVHGTRMRYRQ
ncbi:MAG: pentapeptide repeat-containing protein [Gammaproteobacteria bacterium]|nr:pentapeptide repeat-containing protein [Gammaproteobacteria bacterium]